MRTLCSPSTNPWFKLAEGVSVEDRRAQGEGSREQNRARVLPSEFTATTGIANFLADPATYPLISGTQPDFYRGFMCQTWAHTGLHGAVGLLHPDTHLEGAREGKLRAAAYHRLRAHASFVNEANWAFPMPVYHTIQFGMHIYGSLDEISFLQASQLYGINVSWSHWRTMGQELFRGSNIKDDGTCVHIGRASFGWTQDVLCFGRHSLVDAVSCLTKPRLVHAISEAELGAMSKLGAYRVRLGDCGARISSGYHEMGAKKRRPHSGGMSSLEIGRRLCFKRPTSL